MKTIAVQRFMFFKRQLTIHKLILHGFHLCDIQITPEERRVSVTCRSRLFFFFQAEDGIRDLIVTGVQTCALPISCASALAGGSATNSSISAANPSARAASGAKRAAPIVAPATHADHRPARCTDRKSVV